MKATLYQTRINNNIYKKKPFMSQKSNQHKRVSLQLLVLSPGGTLRSRGMGVWPLDARTMNL